MTSSQQISKSSIKSVSPVSPTREDLDSALDVLNASIDSGLIAQMLDSRGDISDSSPVYIAEDVSPVNVPGEREILSRIEADSTIILKCQMVMDDLQKELDRERLRCRDLDKRLAKSNNEVEQLRLERQSAVESLEALSSQIQELQKEKASQHDSHNKQISSLTSKLEAAERVAERKDFELENMTRHFERRLEEMKNQLKHATSTISVSAISTPPLPATMIIRRSPELELEVEQMKADLHTTHQALSHKDDEMRAVVESFERQVNLLRHQLENSRSYFKKYYAAKAEHPRVSSNNRDLD